MIPASRAHIGGYTEELEATFGAKYNPMYNVFERFVIPIVPISYSKDNKISEVKYQQTAVKYVSTYQPVYTLKYPPKYPQIYTLKYQPTYTPKYEPPYKPNYERPYIPPYKPLYIPPYKPTYTYIPKYPPTYTPKYEPPYPPVYTPPYKPKQKLTFTKLLPEEKKKKRKTLEAFDVYIRKEGKPQLLAKAKPKGKAIAIGLKNVFETARRTTFLKKVGYTTEKDIPIPYTERIREPFPKSKLKKLGDVVLVQKTKYAISSIGEKKEIPGKAAQMRRAGLIK